MTCQHNLCHKVIVYTGFLSWDHPSFICIKALTSLLLTCYHDKVTTVLIKLTQLINTVKVSVSKIIMYCTRIFLINIINIITQHIQQQVVTLCLEYFIFIDSNSCAPYFSNLFWSNPFTSALYVYFISILL